jgi:acyl transferase domain-containing protein
MGALEDYDRFDPLFFSISPKEAELMDPQQRLFLQTCWHAVEDAGYDTRSLSGSRCGVFAGCANSDYQQLSPDQRLTAQGFTGNASSILAGRIAYLLDLQGPCLSIDTACSSSLVAIAYACDSLQSGTSDVALAGGVYVMCGPEMHIKTAQAGMLSASGRCYTFDQRADGFVPGEGVGAVVLKRLSDAERDGDRIYGLVSGWGVNQDGKTNGITAPNPQAQTRLQREVYARFGIDPSRIGLVEAHGTGTKLGDPIEVEALKASFGPASDRSGFCALGSVKSNIGHTLTAAGVAGFLKLMLALQHRQRPPTIQFGRLNEHIDLTGSPFYVSRELSAWEVEPGERRHAAVSSFGFGGTNAHVVVSEYVDARPSVAVPGPVLVVLSARTAERLREKARELSRFVRDRGEGVDLGSLAYTLQVGREAMEERLALVVEDATTLATQLQAFADGENIPLQVHSGNFKRLQESRLRSGVDAEILAALVQRWIEERNLDKLGENWCAGAIVEWGRLYSAGTPRRVGLPVYPFVRERYWLDPADSEIPQDIDRPRGSALHPMLHMNVSNVAGLRYASEFSGEEPFLADHRVEVRGVVEKVLPGVGYLEMARAAFAAASPTLAESEAVQIDDVCWSAPFLARESSRIEVSLMVDANAPRDGAVMHFSILSGGAERSIEHCSGSIGPAVAANRPCHDLDTIAARMRRDRQEHQGIYAALEAMGLRYGPAHRPIESVIRGENELLARLRRPQAWRVAREDRFVLNPGMLDGAVQSVVALMLGESTLPDRPPVPFALDSLRVFSPCPEVATVWLRYAEGAAVGSGLWTFDLDICDESGACCVEMRGFVLRETDFGAGRVDATPVVVDAREDGHPGGDFAFYRNLVDAVAENMISIEEALELS